MTVDLTSNNAFDDYAAKSGWYYDNGGRYREEYCEWYIRDSPGPVLLRQAHDRVCIVRFDGLAPSELWSGVIRTSDEFDQMLIAVGLAA